MQRKIFVPVLTAIVIFIGCVSVCNAYPDRPDSVRVLYELAYFPVRVASMTTAIIWDVPAGSIHDGVKGAVGATKMMVRNLGKDDGVYEIIAGGATGGPVGFLGGSIYGVFHGFWYGAFHGFTGSPDVNNSTGSYSSLFQAKQYIFPYGDNTY